MAERDDRETGPLANGEVKHRHLEVFRAVMRTGNMTTAGRRLGMSQPAVSKFISQTEERCGFPLFERINNRLMPTARAQRLFEEAERLFVGMEELQRLIVRMKSDGPPRIVVTAVPVIAQEVLPRTMAGWLDRQDLQLFVTMRDAGGVLAMVTARNADIGFTMSFQRVQGVRSQLIWRSHAMCAMHADHPLAARDVVTPQDLHDLPFISISRHEGQQQKVDKVLADAQVRPREVAEVPLILGAAGMAHAGIGVTFADVFSARPWLERGLVLRRFEPGIRFEYHAVWIDAPQSRAVVQSLIKAMRDTMKLLTQEALALPSVGPLADR
ncbi:LysR substrate-binding domain-containing protein [Salipiger marinus]|uniref:DNA-binding transcriptional regulator, LysR family n=1 Tax=Salipiger marinus TaxID=555512 RepID=A0A1G8UHY4_9RHOB|nr:LysR substrate-binding domain-containing protein [Salipiger marinus]SDJ53368.1 DNA-binding transcriptional regulator, LysR family [Salipiger marinus]